MKQEVVLALLLLASSAFSQWQPKEAPLMTDWAQEVSPENVLPEYPRPQMVRDDWQNLNGLWQFEEVTNDDDIPLYHLEVLNDTILVPFAVESALSGIMESMDKVWYKRDFNISESWTGKRVLLNFGAVDWHSKIWLNGNFVGEHKGGYDPFAFDITDEVNYTENNQIVVWVYDPTDAGRQPIGKQMENPESIWFTAVTGIWQTVWLEPVPEEYIRTVKVTPDLDNSSLSLHIETNDSLSNNTITAKILDTGQLVSSAYRYGEGELQITIPDAKWWSPDNPFLYGLEIFIQNNAGINDTVQSYFGMRKTSLGKDKNGITRLFLNQKQIFHLGPLDQGYWPDGLYTAPTDEALRFDIEYAQKLGFNMIRKHVKVEPARWYYWTDKLGMLVWQDMPNVKAGAAADRAQFESELKRMVDYLYNFPSIVQWVVFNENWGIYDAARITTQVQEWDPTRQVNQNSGWNVGGIDNKAGDVNDLHHYPDPIVPATEEDRVAVCGEFGGLWRQIDGHTWGLYSGEGYKDENEFANAYSAFMTTINSQIENDGLAAAVYTEITDVEEEYAGMITYDRRVEKCNYLPIYFSNINTIATTLDNKEKIKPDDFRLNQNYPNPFNPTTSISYQLASVSQVDLSIYNILGQKLDTLVDERQTAGNHSVTFNANEMASGIYIYRLRAGKLSEIRKMILIQ